MAIDYLVNAANYMFALANSPLAPEKDTVLTGLASTCGALRQLQKDREFITVLDELETRRESVNNTIDDFIRDVEHFVNGFLEAEAKLLTEAKLDKLSIQMLMKRARDLRAELTVHAIDFKSIQVSIQRLESLTCQKAQQIAQQTNPTEVKRILLNVALALGGIIIVVGNVVYFDLVGLTEVGRIVSGLLGEYIAMKSLDEVIRLLQQT